MMTNPQAYEIRLAELEQRVTSMQADLKRLEDLVAWVVDLLEAMQANAMDRTAGAAPPKL